MAAATPAGRVAIAQAGSVSRCTSVRWGLEQVGVSRTNAKAVLTRMIHLDTIQWVDKLVKTRLHFAKNQPMNKGVM
jgi:hypothetical protein